MDLISLYYYTSMPILTCNMLFYSINSISASITSSQNVAKFISEHKDCDSVIFRNELTNLDVENKLRIIEALIYDILKKYSLNTDELERAKKEIRDPPITESDSEPNDFSIIEFKPNLELFSRIDEPIKIALISTAETISNIDALMCRTNEKIYGYNNSFIKKVVSISLQQELKELNSQMKILDTRLHLLLELLKIYVPYMMKSTPNARV